MSDRRGVLEAGALVVTVTGSTPVGLTPLVGSLTTGGRRGDVLGETVTVAQTTEASLQNSSTVITYVTE